MPAVQLEWAEAEGEGHEEEEVNVSIVQVAKSRPSRKKSTKPDLKG